METIIFSVEDMRQMVQHVGVDALMDEMIDRLTVTFQQYDANCLDIPTRDGFHYEQPYLGLIEWMPVMHKGQTATVKMVGYHPSNPGRHNLPTILSTVSAYDTRSGHLIGLADATFLTALRTGAASAIASQLLAAPQSSIIGLVGAGAQAVTQLHALSRIFEIEKVLVYDSDPSVSDGFLERIAFMGLSVELVDNNSLGFLVKTADIICTATSIDIGQGPVFADIDSKPRLHVNAVGSDFPGKTELPLSLLKRSFVCPDFLEQAIKEGECQQLELAEIGATLVEVVQNQADYEFAQQQTSVFDSTGWALEDQIAMQMLIDYSLELNLGTRIQIEAVSADPRNPYQFVTESSYAVPINSKVMSAV